MESRFYSVRQHCSPAWPWRQRLRRRLWLTSAFNRVCAYGYYGYAPYACAPYGYYGPGYFYNGIFLGMGPWGGWGYSHGWGSHRFSERRRRKLPRRTGACAPIAAAMHAAAAAQSRPAVSHSNGARPSAGHAAVARTSAPRASQATPSRATASHAHSFARISSKRRWISRRRTAWWRRT